MSATEILIRLILGAAFILAGTGFLLSALSERHGPLAAVLVLAAGTTLVAVGVGWPHKRGGDRG